MSKCVENDPIDHINIIKMCLIKSYFTVIIYNTCNSVLFFICLWILALTTHVHIDQVRILLIITKEYWKFFKGSVHMILNYAAIYSTNCIVWIKTDTCASISIVFCDSLYYMYLIIRLSSTLHVIYNDNVSQSVYLHEKKNRRVAIFFVYLIYYTWPGGAN